MKLNKILKPFLLFLPMLFFTAVYAQETEAAKKVVSENNQLEILMGVVAIIFVFVIWGMANILSSLSRQVLDKNTKQGASKVLPLIALMLVSSLAHAQQTPTQQAVQVTPNYGGMDASAFWLMTTVLITEVLVIIGLLIFIRNMLAELMPEKEGVQSAAFKKWWTKMDKKLFTKAVPVEKEKDILLDHDYDGIRELDNSLPPWWKYGFVITIAFAFLYLFNFHVLGYGKDPDEEYIAEMADAAVAKELYEAKNADKVDEADIKMPDANGLAAGKEIFTTVCWACHGKQGEGGAGPNLTDNYWLHKGSISDVYQSIKHGYPDKGMQAWEKNYSPKEINNLAGYIKTLKGTNPPNGKLSQGELFEETSDSSSVKPPIK